MNSSIHVATSLVAGNDFYKSLNSNLNLGILSGGRGQSTINLPLIAPLNIA